FYDGEEPMRYLAYIELRAGATRGNHYHKVKEEWIYLLKGKAVLLLQDIESHEKASVELASGDLVFIPPGIAHAIAIEQPGQAIEFSKVRFDAADIHRFALIEPKDFRK